MKLLFTSLGIFLLFLSCVPCSDTEECNVQQPESISTAAGHEQHSHDSESCTPFCTCSCCAASVYSAPFYKLQANAVSPFSQKHLLLNVDFDAEAHYSIWEPPQLAS